MTYQQSDFTLPAALLAQIAEQGFDTLPELIRIVINEAMRVERQNYLGSPPTIAHPSGAATATISRITRSVRDWAKSPSTSRK